MKLVEDDASINAIIAKVMELQTRIAEERLAKAKMKEEFVRFWLLRFRKLDMTQPEQVAFGEAVKAEKSLDMSARGAPDVERQIERFDVLSFFLSLLCDECNISKSATVQKA